MIISLTDAGIAALQSAVTPLILQSYKLGSAYGYIPATTDTDIHGTLIYQGAPSAPVVINANVVKYQFYLDFTLGPFDFGEFGLYMQNGDLFALATGNSLISKTPITTTPGSGNAIRVDAYLSMVGGSFNMWVDQTESNELRLAVLPSVDQLPPSKDAIPNCYVITGASSSQSSFQAYTDGMGLWNFDCYKYSTTFNGAYTITASTPLSVTIARSAYNDDIDANYFGQNIIQFNSGNDYGICRYVSNVIVNATTVVIEFLTPLALQPAVGDTFIYFSRDPLSATQIVLPIASTTQTGIMQVGAGLAVTTAGLVSVDRTTIPGGIVYSINGKQGTATLNASEVPGTVRSVNNATPDANGNVTISTTGYTLPVATTTTLGGVKAPTGPNARLSIASDGTINTNFTPITDVNGQTGSVTIRGLITPTLIPNAANLNTYQTPGLWFVTSDGAAATLVNAPSGALSGTLEVIPQVATGSGDVIQRWQQQGAIFTRKLTSGTWGPWVQPGASIPIATNSVLGAIIVGNGLSVDAGGNTTVNTATIPGGVVTSVNGLQGNVNITPGSLGLAPVATSGQYRSLVGVPNTVDTLTVSRDLLLTDDNKYLRYAGATGITITVRPQTTTAYVANTYVAFRQNGAGQITFVADTGVTINAPFGGTLVTAGQGATVALVRGGVNDWDLIGVTEEA